MTTMPPPILLIEDLHKSYGANKVINGLSLSIARGECFGLLGPNGAGKTTALRLCLGLTAADSGRILLADLPVPERGREARLRVGVVISVCMTRRYARASPSCWSSPA